jgi:hypothetical protein
MNTFNYHMQFEDLIGIYLCNGLDNKERVEFETHSQSCSPCRQSLDEARIFEAKVFQVLIPDRAPKDLEDRLVNAFRTEVSLQAGERSRGMRIFLNSRILTRWIALPAAALVCIIIGAVIMTQPMTLGKHMGESATRKSSLEVLCSAMPEAEQASVDKSLVTRYSRNSGNVQFEQKGSNNKSDVFANSPVTQRMNLNEQVEHDGVLVAESKPEDSLKKVLGNSSSLPAIKDAIDSSRKIIKTGVLTFEVESFENAYQKVVGILGEERGYVASSSTTVLGNGKVQGQIVIRFLPERFDTITLKLRTLGELKHQEVSSEDVTKQYVDLMARLGNAKTLETRLLQLMNDKKAQIKDLLEVEKNLADVREKIERFQGEIKYYDNLTSLATLTLDITEKDMGQVVEYVQTQTGNLVVAVADVEKSYQKTQEIVHALKGQIVWAQLNNADKRLQGDVQAYVDAEQFFLLVEQLKGLGEVKSANLQQQTSTGGTPPAKPENAKIRKERGLISLSLRPPSGEYVQAQEARVDLEVVDVDKIYAQAQQVINEGQAKILNGNINRGVEQVRASLVCQVEAERFRAVVESLKILGKVKIATMEEHQTAQGVDSKSILPVPVRKDPAMITLSIYTPMAIVTEDSGVMAAWKKTLKNSIQGVLLSLQFLIVGFLAVAPWILAVIAVFMIVKKFTSKKSESSKQKAQDKPIV